MKIPKSALTAALAAGLLTLAAACGGSGSGTAAAGSGGLGKPSKTPLTLMFGSSGPAETKAVQAAAAAFTKQSGIKVTVVAASNLVQQLGQGFAGGQPPDVFYLDPGSFQNYAKQGALQPYPADLPNAGGFYPALRASFTYKGTFTCEPKDASTLALYINTRDWRQAGLTPADIPRNWAQLQTVAKKLTTAGRTGLVLDQTHSGLDEFLIAHQSPSLDTLTTGVGRLVSGQLGTATQYPLKLAAALVMTLPVAIIFFLFQKHILRTTEGAVKE